VRFLFPEIGTALLCEAVLALADIMAIVLLIHKSARENNLHMKEELYVKKTCFLSVKLNWDRSETKFLCSQDAI